MATQRTLLLEALNGKPLLCDGAMGTQLQLAGLAPGVCGELWNLEQSDKVLAIQRNYAQAGSDCLITNTFGGCAHLLKRHGLHDRVYEINRAGAEIARKALGDRGWVLGDVGPFGDLLQPFGTMSEDELSVMLTEQIRGLLDGGADAIVCETQSAVEEAAVGVRAARELGAPCVIVSFTYQKAGNSFRTMMGVAPTDVVDRLEPLGVDIYGANCGTGLDIADYSQILAEYRSRTTKPLMAQPNAGQPQMEHGKLVYLETPEKMAARVGELVQAGTSIVGGCCGTTPEHIALFRQQLDRG